MEKLSTNTGEPSTIIRAVNCGDDNDILRFFLLNHGGSNPVEISISHIKSELDKRSEKFFSVYLVGSCNGLVCLDVVFGENRDRNQLVLWNPATREFKYLPESIPPEVSPGSYCTECPYHEHCFGFDEESDDYKIVRVDNFSMKEGEKEALEVQLFTKSSGSWRRLRGFSGIKLTRSTEQGVAAEGAMHWAALRGQEPAKGNLFRLLTFDIRTEEMKEIDGPAFGSGDDVEYRHLELIKWKGCLGAIMTTVGREREVWVKAKNGSGWSKMVTIEAPKPSWAFRGVLRDRFLFFNQGKREDFLYDPLTKEKRLFIEEFGKIIAYNFQEYIPSLISPN